MTVIYKLLADADWAAAQAQGRFEGAGVDLRDGYIHFSAADQVCETARLHYAARSDLVLLSVDAGLLGDRLAWEPSRGGGLFPHLYGALPVAAVIHARPVALDGDGLPQLDALIP